MAESNFVNDLGALRRRQGTKWSRFGDDVLPAWIADMDVLACPAVTDAMSAILTSGDLGYPSDDIEVDVAEAFCQRMTEAHRWQPDLTRVKVLSDVVQGVCAAVEVLTERGAGVIVQTPAYPPFLSEITAMGRTVVPQPLVRTDHSWDIDFEDLEAACVTASVLILVNPHNPTGRVFSASELARIIDIAKRNQVVVLCDEIHAEFAWDRSHTPIESLPGGSEVAATFTSPTKAFNLAGARCAVAHLGSELLESRWSDIAPPILGAVSTLGAVGAIAAWRDGAGWLETTRSELLANRSVVTSFVNGHPEEIRYHQPEGTYLAWLHLPRFHRIDPATWFEEFAGIALGHGEEFGSQGERHVRLNFATGPQVLNEILERFSNGLERSGSDTGCSDAASLSAPK